MTRSIKQAIVLLLTSLTLSNAEAQSDLMLVFPANGDTLQTQNPLFSWYQMSGNANGDRYTYTFLLAEIQAGQTPEEALQLNVPVLRLDGLQQQQLLYPPTAPALQQNVWYAWQVQKVLLNQVVDRSESWKFILASPQPKKNEPQYTRLKVKNDGVEAEAVNGKLYFIMDEPYQEGQTSIEVLDANQQVLTNQVTINRENDPNNGAVNLRKTGANFYELDLGALNKAGSYVLKTRNSKNQEYVLPFVVR